MRVRRRALRTVLAAVGSASVVAWAVVGHGSPTSAQDADLYLVRAGVNAGPFAPVVSSTGYTLSSGACRPLAVPSPVSTSVPGYLDVPPHESGNCTSFSGGGTLTVVNCTTGVVTAGWNLLEPAGDTAAFNGQGVMVGGVAVIAAPPSTTLGTGYWDPSSAPSPGAAVGVALFVSTGLVQCPSPGVIDQVTAAIVAGY
jgi:hypothetical protein